MGWLLKGRSSKEYSQWKVDQDIVYLLTFASVVKYRHFRNPTPNGEIDQSTISNRIDRLEAFLGQRLFDRKGRSEVRINRNGVSYIPRALELLSEAVVEIENAKKALEAAMFSDEIVPKSTDNNN